MRTFFFKPGGLPRLLPMLAIVFALGIVAEAAATDFCWRDS